ALADGILGEIDRAHAPFADLLEEPAARELADALALGLELLLDRLALEGRDHALDDQGFRERERRELPRLVDLPGSRHARLLDVPGEGIIGDTVQHAGDHSWE